MWRRNQGRADVAELYQSKLLLGKKIIQTWVDNHPDLKLPVTFDSWYSQPAFCRFLTDTVQVPYVGTLNASDKILLQSRKITVAEFASKLKQEHNLALQNGNPPIAML